MKSLWEYPPPQTKVPASAPHLPNNILALYLGQQALERCGESVLCSCMPALASSGTAPASSGEVVKILREAARSWILGHNVFLWSCKVKIYVLGAFGALSPAPANLARARHQLRQSQTPTSKSHNSPSTRSSSTIQLYSSTY